MGRCVAKVFIRRLTSNLSPAPVFLSAYPVPAKVALYWNNGHQFLTYGELQRRSDRLMTCFADSIQCRAPPSLNELISEIDSRSAANHRYDVTTIHGIQPRVAILCESDDSFVTSLYAVWKMGGVAIPLCKTHPQEELEYVLTDSGTSLLVSSNGYTDMAHQLSQTLNLTHFNVTDNSKENDTIVSNDYHDDVSMMSWNKLGAMLLYTSGTTGRPKGVLLTHRNISAQIAPLLSVWEYSSSDVVLHTLPLHHLHGILNILLCPLACGASIVMHQKFDPEKVWQSLLGDSGFPQVSVFSAVPTMYNRLLQYYESAGHSDEEKKRIKNYCQSNIRLMMSGSSALPESIFNKWKDVTGHALLERYGMTEVGMALSHSYKGRKEPGTVGYLLPTMKARLVPEDADDVKTDIKSTGTEEGELHLQGPGIYHGYWNKPDETLKTFTEDHWFMTGDIAECNNGVYKILGRSSIDILKSGGYKISGLEIERAILEHSSVSECAVVGIDDKDLGQRIVAVIVPSRSDQEIVAAIKDCCTVKLARYKVPRLFIVRESLPRNAMGKVSKKDLVNDILTEAV